MEHEISLPIEIAEPILVTLLRHFARPSAGSSAPVRPALNTLSRTLAPDVTRAALIKLWWYSLDHIPSCSTSWLLPMLLDLERRYDRPLMYSAMGLGLAARRGDFATMDAWIDAGLLTGLTTMDEGSGLTEEPRLCIARHEGAHGKCLIQVLDWWLERGLPWGDQEAIETDLEIASSSAAVGEDVCIQALEWWRAQKEVMIVLVPKAALVAASRAGYVRVLEWWWTHFGSSVKCTSETMDAAVESGGHLHVLEWWDSKFPLHLPLATNPKKQQASVLEHIADLASQHGHAHILEWWFDSIAGLSESYRNRTKAAIDYAAANGHIAVLDFWLARSTHADEHQRMSFMYKYALDWACAAGRIQVLEWFARHAKIPKSPSKPGPLLHWPAQSAQSITIECLEWRQRHKVQTQFLVEEMAEWSSGGRLDILEWISSNFVSYECGFLPLVRASLDGHVPVLGWWLNELGIDKFRELASISTAISATCHLPVLQWLADKQVNLVQLCLSTSPHMRERQLVAWAIDCAGAKPEDVIRQCIDLCMAGGEHETIDWCVQMYPTVARQALSLMRLRDHLGKVQFGIIEYLVQRGLLPVAKSNEHTLLADSIDHQQVNMLIEYGGENLAMLDWIQKHYQSDASDRSHLFALTPADVKSAREYGHLGMLRWIQRKKVEIRAFGVDGDGFGVGEWYM